MVASRPWRCPVTAPARSVFAEPLAQVAEALRDYRDAGDRPGMYVAGQEALAALDLIEQRATGMEKALRRIADIPAGSDDDGIYARGIARIALSAREEAQ